MNDDLLDRLELPDFLRRTANDNEVGAQTPVVTTISPVITEEEKWKRYEAERREHRLLKSRGRVAKMLAVKADRTAVASGKVWDVRRGRWV